MLKIQYLSHSAFILRDGIYSVIIDPFLTGNPNAPIKAESVKADYIILSHGHGDHFGDTPQIAKKNDATVIAVHELALYCQSRGCKSHPMHIGGKYKFPFGTVKFTIAHHGSSNNDGRYMGEPAGMVINIGGKNVYHCGDTGLFSDMKLIGEMDKIDVMLVPIGGNFTMDIADAVKAVELVNPDLVLPMHYNTFPAITTDPDLFVREVAAIGKKALHLEYGQIIEI